MDEFMAMLQGIRQAVELVDAKVTGIDSRLDNLEQRVSIMDTRLDNLEQRIAVGFADLGCKIDSVSEDIAVLDQMYGRHERMLRRVQYRA